MQSRLEGLNCILEATRNHRHIGMGSYLFKGGCSRSNIKVDFGETRGRREGRDND